MALPAGAPLRAEDTLEPGYRAVRQAQNLPHPACSNVKIK